MGERDMGVEAAGHGCVAIAFGLACARSRTPEHPHRAPTGSVTSTGAMESGSGLPLKGGDETRRAAQGLSLRTRRCLARCSERRRYLSEGLVMTYSLHQRRAVQSRLTIGWGSSCRCRAAHLQVCVRSIWGWGDAAVQEAATAPETCQLGDRSLCSSNGFFARRLSSANGSNIGIRHWPSVGMSRCRSLRRNLRSTLFLKRKESAVCSFPERERGCLIDHVLMASQAGQSRARSERGCW